MGLKLIGEVGLDGSGFERGLAGIGRSATQHLKGFVASAFGLYGIEEAIKKTVERADELVNTSKRLGVGVEQLQVLKQAAKDNGTEMEQLTRAFEKLDVARAKALGGSAEGQKLMGRFQQLGISREDLQSKTAANLFMGPMRNAAKNMNPEDLGPVLKDIIGKGFGEVIPVLSTDFEELQKKMQAMGVIMDSTTAVKLKALGDEFSLLSQLITTQVGPALIALAEGIYTGLLKIGQAVSGMAAAVGAGTSKWGAGDWLKGLVETSPLGALFHLVKSKGDLGAAGEDIAKATGFDLEAAAGASDEAQKPWIEKQKQLDALLKELEEKAKALDHQKPPTFDVEDESPLKPHREKQYRERGDALTRVGNFLGSSKDVLSDLAQKQVNLLQQIANNTRQSFSGGGGDTAFPTE